MEGSAGHRLVSARSAVGGRRSAVGVLAFAFNVAALVLSASAGQSVGQPFKRMKSQASG